MGHIDVDLTNPTPTARRQVEDAIVDARVAFAHEGGYLAATLARLADLMGAHATDRQSTKALDEIVDTAPRLAGDVARLVGDHLEIPAELAELRIRLRQLRDDVSDVCDRIVEHHRFGDHLAYEAFLAEFGGD